ncbi:MAG TPA: hypothetical protein VHC69_14255 [Polyangiaceae bacterium]|nr:hypothetical protein [Polyangiaceae bacterium]
MDKNGRRVWSYGTGADIQDRNLTEDEVRRNAALDDPLTQLPL